MFYLINHDKKSNTENDIMINREVVSSLKPQDDACKKLNRFNLKEDNPSQINCYCKSNLSNAFQIKRKF